MAIKINKNTTNVYKHLLKMYHSYISVDENSNLAMIKLLLEQHFDLALIDNVNEFYIRIDRQIWDKNVNSVVVNYYILNNDSSVGEKLEGMISNYIHSANPEVNLLSQAYEYLKTLPEFVGCEDC